MYRIQVEGGVRCAVQELGPKGRRIALFVHGWPLAKEIFEYQYNVLPQYDIRCVSYDLRGYGESDKPWQGYDYDRLADDLYRIIRSLEGRRVILCGFSMGGAVCVRYMARHRGHCVSKLVLMGAAAPMYVQHPGNPNGMTREQVDGLISQCYNNRPALSATFSRMCFANDPGPDFLSWFTRIGEQAASQAVIQGLEALRDEDLRADMGKIRVPTAIFHGLRDRVCPFAMAQEMNQGIPGSALIPFENSGHCLFYEERDKCNSNLVQFINQQ